MSSEGKARPRNAAAKKPARRSKRKSARKTSKRKKR
jgi:hypothetical protein